MPTRKSKAARTSPASKKLHVSSENLAATKAGAMPDTVPGIPPAKIVASAPIPAGSVGKGR